LKIARKRTGSKNEAYFNALPTAAFLSSSMIEYGGRISECRKSRVLSVSALARLFPIDCPERVGPLVMIEALHVEHR